MAFAVGCALIAAPVAPAWAADEGWWPGAAAGRPSAGAPRRGEDGRYLPPVGPAPYGDPTLGDTGRSWAVAPGATLPPVDSRSRAVERSELPPVLASDGSGLPLELWAGLDLKAVEALVGALEMPPRSPALRSVWRRMLKASAPPPQGATQQQFAAVRAEALYRSGLLGDADEVLQGAGGSDDAVLLAMRARLDIARGRSESGCQRAKAAAVRRAGVPPALRDELPALLGYCAAASGDRAGAGLAAELAREEGNTNEAMLEALDAVAAGRAPQPGRWKRIGPVAFRLLNLVGPVDAATLLARADPALIAVLASDTSIDPRLRLAAAEAAASQGFINPEGLAAAYRAQSFAAEELADALGAKRDPLRRRALLLQAAEQTTDPQRKARLLKALLDDARSIGCYLPLLAVTAPLIEDLPKVPETAWFAETAVEAAVAARRPESAAAWARLAASSRAGNLEHWLALADIASSSFPQPRGSSFPSLEELLQRGRLSPAVLQRLATVLDALDYQVPMSLWRAAGAVPQPNEGYLPETGTLSELLRASQRRNYGQTVLLALQSLGPAGAEGAHIIALGDTIRALKRANLGEEARQLAFEALFASWPRSATN